MKILLCNDFVRNCSGIDAIVETERRCLEREGHEVVLYAKHNDEWNRAALGAKLRLGFATFYSFAVARELNSLLSEGKFDLVHVHNTVPFITGAVYDACAKHPGIPVVQSLHNYRAVCPTSYSFRNGRTCRQCADYSLACCVLHGCYRHSRLQSLALVFARWLDAIGGRRLGMKADAYLAVSEHVRNAHIEFGLPPGAIRVLPNAVKDLQQDVSAAAQTPIRPAKKLVYAGAIIEAKGVFVLCHLANTLPEFEFHLLGDGEDFRRLERQISAMQLPNIVLHASKINGDKVAIWSDAFLTVIPSLWNEPFGLCAAESFSLGIPVATTGSGGLSEIITHDQNGMVLDFSDPENVATQIRELWDNSRTYAQLRENARHTFETRYTEDVYSRNLSMALTDIIEERGAAQ